MKSRMPDAGRVWSMPTRFLDASIGPLLEAPDALVRSATELLPHPVSTDELFHFIVLNPYPERKHIERPGYMYSDSLTVNVLEMRNAGMRDGLVSFRETSNRRTLDLRFLCHLQHLCDLRSWEVKRVDGSVESPQRIHNEETSIQITQGLPHENDDHLMILDIQDAPGDILAIPSQDTNSFLERMLADGCTTTNQRSMSFLDVGIPPHALDSLVEVGLLEQHVDEFGELRVSVVPSACTYSPNRLCLPDPVSILSHTIGGDFPNRHKLELILHLVSDGWYGIEAACVFRGDAKEFQWKMLQRSTAYFSCLAIADDVFSRGADRILSTMNHTYDVALFTCKKLSVLCALEDEALCALSTAQLFGYIADGRRSERSEDIAPAPALLDAPMEELALEDEGCGSDPEVEPPLMLLGPIHGGYDASA